MRHALVFSGCRARLVANRLKVSGRARGFLAAYRSLQEAHLPTRSGLALQTSARDHVRLFAPPARPLDQDQ